MFFWIYRVVLGIQLRFSARITNTLNLKPSLQTFIFILIIDLLIYILFTCDRIAHVALAGLESTSAPQVQGLRMCTSKPSLIL